MPLGFRVALGTDNTLWFGDSVATASETFTAASRIGAGSLRATGTLDGESFTDREIGGIFHTNAAGQLYFEPDNSGLTISSATISISPIYNNNSITATFPALGNNLNGSSTPETFFGEGGNDTIEAGGALFTDGGTGGEADTDVLYGGTGNDNMRAEGGWDRLQGNAGNDTLNGGYGMDIADYSDGTAGINLTIANGTVNLSGAGLGTDSLQGMDGAIGTNFADTIIGYDDDGEDPDGSAYTNYIDGAGGNDSIDGRTGSDFLFGGTGGDTIIGGLWDGDAGVVLRPGRLSELGGTVDDRIFGGLGDDVIYGDDIAGTNTLGGNDYIEGGDGADRILAGAGIDTVFGDAGNDTIDGGAGADSISAGAGDDIINLSDGHGADTVAGGTGTDTLSGAALSNSATVGYANGAGNLAEGGSTVTFTGVESIVTGAGADRIDASGNTAEASFSTGAGNDTIIGGSGAETMTGGMGNDFFVVGSGDVITDFGAGSTGSPDDGDPTNNDSVNLGDFYNAENLAVLNAARVSQGLAAYRNPLDWARADQADDGVLNSITTANGFASNFTLTLRNGGTAVEAVSLTNETLGVVCFAADVRIETATGPVAAGDLRPGMLVVTKDGGLQPIRWIGRRRLSAADLAAKPELRPIRIRKGALGSGQPTADLVVSPQHRILVRSRIAERMFGASEVLVAAKQLCAIPRIEIAEDIDAVVYVHFLLDTHQIVLSNGAETESLHPGPQALKTVGLAALEEIFTLFPELRAGANRPAARILCSGRQGRQLAARHAAKNRELVATSRVRTR